MMPEPPKLATPYRPEQLSRMSYIVLDMTKDGMGDAKGHREVVFSNQHLNVRFEDGGEFRSLTLEESAAWAVWYQAEYLKAIKKTAQTYKALNLMKKRRDDNTLGWCAQDEENKFPTYEEAVENIRNLNSLVKSLESCLKQR